MSQARVLALLVLLLAASPVSAQAPGAAQSLNAPSAPAVETTSSEAVTAPAESAPAPEAAPPAPLPSAPVAQPVTVAAPPAPAPVVATPGESAAPGKWSFGAGLSTGFYGDQVLVTGASNVGNLGGYGGYTMSRPGLNGVALIERMVNTTLRMGLSATGSYGHTNNNIDGPYTGPKDGASGSAALATSLRWVLNPGQVVEASPLVALGGFYTGSTGRSMSTQSNTDSTLHSINKSTGRDLGLEARVGFVVEYRLLPRLYLRLETHFARLAYDHSKSTLHALQAGQATVTTHLTSDNVNLNFGIQPSLQMRVVL